MGAHMDAAVRIADAHTHTHTHTHTRVHTHTQSGAQPCMRGAGTGTWGRESGGEVGVVGNPKRTFVEDSRSEDIHCEYLSESLGNHVGHVTCHFNERFRDITGESPHGFTVH
jgi:hypothetical protein